MELIQSRQNPQVKLCVKLAESRRERFKQSRTLLDGTHLIAAALDANLLPDRLLVANAALAKAEVATLLERFSGPISLLDDKVFDAITDLESASGLVGIWPIPEGEPAKTSGLILALDGVQDPGNVGSIMRTAVAAGVEQIWLGIGCADAWSPKVLRAGMGAHFALPVIERADLVTLAQAFQGSRFVTVLDDSIEIYDADLRGDVLLTMGSEGQGVSADMVAMADACLRIPMHAGIESLNVGAAAAVCLFECVRQRR